MTEQWQELKETIIEMRDNNGTGTQQEVCKFLVNYMNVLEKQMQESKWILTKERLPEKSQWVLVTTEEYQKPIEIMCYQGIRIGKHDVGNGWEEYEYPSWTSGHGDVQGYHPKAWMPIKPYKEESE